MFEIRQWAADHHGVVSRTEAKLLGLSESQIDRCVVSGEFNLLAPGVYGIAGTPETWLRRARAEALSARALVSHRAAAAVHGIDGFPIGTLELTIPATRSVRREGLIIHRTSQFGRCGAVEVDGIPVTSVERTVLDLAAVVSPRRLGWVVDAVLREERCDWPDLFEVWLRHSIQGRNGCGPLRQLVEERFGESSIPDSRWNRMVGEMLVDAGLPIPQYEYEITDDSGQFIARVDLAYAHAKVAIELDSVRWHMNRESFEADPRRKNRLTVAGWTVLSFTWSDFVDRPGELIRTVREALAQNHESLKL